MSLHILKGNLFDVEADTYVVTINLVGAMGAGVAKEARDRIPGLYKHYKKMFPVISPGEFILYQRDGKKYLLVPTKINWRDPSPRDLVQTNLHRLAYITRRYAGWGRVALPPFGCGNGKLDWDGDISHLYKALFEHHPTEFLVVL